MNAASSTEYLDETLGDLPEVVRRLLASKDAELHAQKLQIEKLMVQLAAMRRHRFGTKSEGLDQLGLAFDDLEVDRKAGLSSSHSAEAQDDEADAPGSKPKRKALPDHLPRDAQTHRPASTICPCCGKDMAKLGEDIREVLDFVPASFIVRQHAIEKYVCRDCDHFAEGELPSQPIEKGMAGPGLLAHVLVSKYADSLPLYRQSEIFARQDIDIARSTMAGWVGKMGDLLAPLADRIEKHVLAGDAIHADDTVVPVLTPGLKKTKKGRIWTHVRDERPWGSAIPPAVFYKYSPDRKGEHPQKILDGYDGLLHVDGYSGYRKLFECTRPFAEQTQRLNGKAREAACLAHIRRKFFDIHKANASPIAEKALEFITALYRIEKEIKGKPPDIRKAIRQERSKPIFEDFQNWLDATLPTLFGRSELAKTMRYAITQMKKLEKYLDDGRVSIDNNCAERSIKNIVLGRKNFLFFGSDAGGTRAAIIYTLLQTAKLNGVNPQSWLAYVIENIADWNSQKIDELLPWNFKPEMQAGTI